MQSYYRVMLTLSTIQTTFLEVLVLFSPKKYLRGKKVKKKKINPRTSEFA